MSDRDKLRARSLSVTAVLVQSVRIGPFHGEVSSVMPVSFHYLSGTVPPLLEGMLDGKITVPPVNRGLRAGPVHGVRQ